jgi:hypothetical protein
MNNAAYSLQPKHRLSDVARRSAIETPDRKSRVYCTHTKMGVPMFQKLLLSVLKYENFRDQKQKKTKQWKRRVNGTRL